MTVLLDHPNTVALLHFRGADASTTITDESGKTWTARGNAQLDTGVASPLINGGSVLLLDGTGDWVDTPNHADFDFGSGDFTVEFWFRFSSLTGSQDIFTKRANNTVFSPCHIGIAGGVLFFRSSANGSSWGVQLDWTYGVNIVINTWYHLAAVRSGNAWNLYIDGTSKANTTASQTVMTNTTVLSAGADANGDNPFNGQLEELVVRKGVAKYTANFTPQRTEFVNGSFFF